MARTAQIHYQRITFSMPSSLVKDLRTKMEKNKMSQYVSKILEADLTKYAETDEEFFASVDALRNNLQKTNKKSCLEMIKEFRNGNK